MTVVYRSGRPNRPNLRRNARLGVLALFALGGAGGCGQAALRSSGASLASDAIPGRKLLWEAPQATSSPSSLTLAGIQGAGAVSLEGGITAGPPPSVAIFDGSTYARTTWNGWKVPAPKLPGLTDGTLLASDRPTDPGPSDHPMPDGPLRSAEYDALMVACAETKIAPPKRPTALASRTTKPDVSATPSPKPDGGLPGKTPNRTPETAPDDLLAACEAAKIPPPRSGVANQAHAGRLGSSPGTRPRSLAGPCPSADAGSRRRGCGDGEGIARDAPGRSSGTGYRSRAGSGCGCGCRAVRGSGRCDGVEERAAGLVPGAGSGSASASCAEGGNGGCGGRAVEGVVAGSRIA